MDAPAVVHAALYREVLARWRRCDAEGALVAAELRRAERGDGAPAAALARLLRARCGLALQATLRRWALHASQLAGMAALRYEAGACKEVQLALEAAREELRTVRDQWHGEREQWRQREQAELALLQAAQDSAPGSRASPAPLNEQCATAAVASEAPDEAAAPRALRAHATSCSACRASAAPQPHACSAAASAAWPPQPMIVRGARLGARAEALLAAWTRESAAPTVDG